MDKDGNPVGLAKANSILNTRAYTFTFANGDENILNVILIAEGNVCAIRPRREPICSP